MDPNRQTPAKPEKERYTYDEMMARLRSQRSGGGGSHRVKVEASDGSIEVKRRKRRSHQPVKERQQRIFKLRKNALLVAVSVVLLLIGAYLLLNVRYQSDSYSSSLSQQASRFIGAETELAPLNIKGLNVRSRRLFIEPDPGSLLQDAEFISLHGKLTLGSLFAPDWHLTNLDALHGKLRFHAPPRSLAEHTQPVEQGAGRSLIGAGLGFSSSPTAFKMDMVRAGATDFVWVNGLRETVFLKDATLSSEQIGSGSKTDMLISGAKLRFGEWPEFDLDTAKVSFNKEEIRVSDALLHHNSLGSSGGDATLSGLVDVSGPSPLADFECEFVGIPAASLVESAWKGKIEGFIDATLNFQADLSKPDSLKVSGSFLIPHGSLGDITPTKRLAVVLAEPRISTVKFHSIRGKITIIEGARLIEDIVAKATGLLIVTGSYRIEADGLLSGSLDLSIANEILDKLPCGRPDFFTEVDGNSGMSSTPVQLGGTSSEPTEDLTKRIELALEKYEIESAAPPASSYPTIPLAPEAIRSKQKSPEE